MIVNNFKKLEGISIGYILIHQQEARKTCSFDIKSILNVDVYESSRTELQNSLDLMFISVNN